MSVKNQTPLIPLVWAFVRYRPLIPNTLCLISGILLAAWSPLPLWFGLGLCIMGIGISVFFVIRKRKNAGFLLGLTVFFCLGFVLMESGQKVGTEKNHIATYADKGKVDVEGTVAESVRYFPDHANVTVDASRIFLPDGIYMPVTGLISVRVKTTKQPLFMGDRVRFKTDLRRIENYKTPGVFDYASYMGRRKILVSGYVRKADAFAITHPRGFSIRGMVEKARGEIRQFIQSTIPTPESEILCALILGEKDRIPKNVQEQFRVGGVAHLLAISGMHIGGIFALGVFARSLVDEIFKLGVRAIQHLQSRSDRRIGPCVFLRGTGDLAYQRHAGVYHGADFRHRISDRTTEGLAFYFGSGSHHHSGDLAPFPV